MKTFAEAAARLAAGVGAARGWPPDEFWRSTPADIELALGVVPGVEDEAPSRSELEALMARFPDRKDQ